VLLHKDSEPIINAIVLLLEAEKLKPLTIREAEARLGGIVEASESVLGPDGPGLILRVPKKHIEVVFTSRKWEINSRGQSLNEDMAKSMAQIVHVLADYVENPQWKAIGYNYNLIFDAPDKKTAIEAIAVAAIAKKALDRKSGYVIKGASTSLYFDIEDKQLWLRLEPRGGDRESNMIWAYANFHQKLEGSLISENRLAKEFLRFNAVFVEILGRF